MTSYEIEDSTYLDEIEANATGHRIKFLARKAGLSQSELAKLLKRDEKTISNYYCGKSLPDKVDLIILSKILGTDYDNLLVYRGDLEGYQRIDYYSIEYNGKENEINHEAISRATKESKLFDPHTKGRCNIRNLEEAGYCLAFFCYLT
ncbi:helix-turn-helix domain-containing protein [Oceanobacillus oncorhynchi]|uniref:helix-turn-helix domain-containing protein n=1 Tax=Oceanobacillus oncorhynchi TaxID=545501 RepID=UPI0034D3CF75